MRQRDWAPCKVIVRPSVRPCSAMSPGPVFVALVNPKSGGNVGSTLLARFRDILDGGRVYNLAEEGPKRALEEHWGKPNLRIIGRTQTLALDRNSEG